MKRILLIIMLLMVAVQVCMAQVANADGWKIIVTTPGYTSIYRYGKGDFTEGIAKDLRIQGATVESSESGNGEKVDVVIGGKTYSFTVNEELPIVRLVFDRNKRQFTGVGCNYIENQLFNYFPPSFKGNALSALPEVWHKEIERLIDDKSLISPGEPHVFIFEAEIDENGIVQKIVELNGALKQYSTKIIDKIYEMAVRGWQPATRNGVPYKTYAHIMLEISR